MNLHSAIEKLLIQSDRPLTTLEIADALNANKWYVKKDRSDIDHFQIYGRAKNYPHIFIRDGSTIALHKKKLKCLLDRDASQENSHTPNNLDKASLDYKIVVNKLMDEGQLFRVADIDCIIPFKSPGLYCIRIKDISTLSRPYSEILSERNHNILYIGKATCCLKKRFLDQELRGIGHGTFFRSLGAMLEYRPQIGTLVGRKNKHNYKFTLDDSKEIINWINSNLLCSWIECNGISERLETKLISEYLPLVNLAKNPAALQLIRDLRKECKRVAGCVCR